MLRAALRALEESLCRSDANERQQQYLNKDLPLICKQLEMLERSRINALHKCLTPQNHRKAIMRHRHR